MILYSVQAYICAQSLGLMLSVLSGGSNIELGNLDNFNYGLVEMGKFVLLFETFSSKKINFFLLVSARDLALA